MTDSGLPLETILARIDATRESILRQVEKTNDRLDLMVKEDAKRGQAIGMMYNDLEQIKALINPTDGRPSLPSRVAALERTAAAGDERDKSRGERVFRVLLELGKWALVAGAGWLAHTWEHVLEKAGGG